MVLRTASLGLVLVFGAGCATTPPPGSPRRACERVGNGPPVHVHLRIENRMGSGFELAKFAWTIDGVPPLSDVEQAKLVARLGGERLATYELSLPSGCHRVDVLVENRGNGSGVFAYLKGYRFEIKTAYAFDAVENETVSFIAYEQGGAETPLEERPALRFTEQRP
jgi:hypothetical protein